MSEEAQSTLGMTLLMDGAYIGELVDPTLPDATATVASTNSQNNSGGIETSLVTWIKHGEMTFKVLYTGSTAQETLRTEIYDREMHTWTVIMPPTFHGGGHSFAFQGQFTKSAPVMNGNDPATIEFSVTCNGKLIPVTTWAAGLTTPFFSIVDNDSNALTPVPAASTAGTTYAFDVEAYSDDTSILVTPTAAAGTIRVNGTIVVSGAASTAITLNTGTGAITYVNITVTELNKTPKVYVLKVALGPTVHP